MSKEGKEVVALIKSNPKAYSELRKATILSYSTMVAFIVYLISLDNYDSSNELAREELKALPFMLVSSYAMAHYHKKAVKIYNSGIEGKIGFTQNKATLGFIYKF